jgi:hypothetical protein
MASVTDPRTAARRELAAELAQELEARLRDLDTFRGGCPCRHAEARAFLAKLRRLAGDAAAPASPRAAGPVRPPYAR